MTVAFNITAACLIGFVADLILGERLPTISPAVLFGKLISWLEKPLRAIFPKSRVGERIGGTVLVVIVCVVAFVGSMLVLWACWLAHPIANLVVQAFAFYMIMATRGLRDASMKVYRALLDRDRDAARAAVGEIVGRDTDSLNPAGVTRATVETVAENTSDGAIAPLFYFLIGGAPLSLLYKAINTMDSMLGYRNERYRYFGTVAARLDDAANYIPARLSALLLVAASWILRLDARGAWSIWRRDARKHSSPNAGHPEAAVAGALGVQLGGDAYYFGELVHKERLGDPVRSIAASDILRANNLLYVSASLCCALGLAVRIVLMVLL